MAAAALGLSVLGSGCTADRETDRAPLALGGDSELVDLFAAAELDSGVPAEILASIAYEETRLRTVAPDPDGHDHDLGLIGLMALRRGGERDIVRAAELIGAPEAALWLDQGANIGGAAALLAEVADRRGLEPRLLGDWHPALASYGGDAFADKVLARVARGWRGQDAGGRWLICSAREVHARDGSLTAGIGTRTLSLGYDGARWDPAHSSNYEVAGRTAADIDMIVVHTMQGSYSGGISWFKNPSSNVSAHYMVRSSDGDITQMVDDADKAWHASCKNPNSIGIEHEGFVDDPAQWYTTPLYTESAKLVAWLAAEYGVPLDRNHIVAHSEVGCTTHTDPGSGWDWDHFMELVENGGQGLLRATESSKSYPNRMTSGEVARVYFEFVNDGSLSWGGDATRLGTQMPADRQSDFYVDGGWLSPSRPGSADEPNYAPGAVGRFSFDLRAPSVDEATTYVENFQLVQGDGEWFGPVVSIEIEVVPDSGGGDWDGDDSDAGFQEVTGGCATGGGRYSGGPGWMALVAIAGLLARRRRY